MLFRSGSAETNGIRDADGGDLGFAYFRDGDTVSLGGTASDTVDELVAVLAQRR